MNSNKGDGLSVDHKNGNTLDCQKENLRKCRNVDNVKNQRKSSINKSGFKGVNWYKAADRWEAGISVDGIEVYLGLYDSVETAAASYDIASILLHGEYMNINFPAEKYDSVDKLFHLLSCISTRKRIQLENSGYIPKNA